MCLVLAAVTAVRASEPSIWSVNSRTDVMKGNARSVSVDANGTIRTAPKMAEVFNTGQQYVWSAVESDNAVYLGTGPEGKVFRTDQKGGGEMIADLAELNVTAMAAAKDGGLFAATAPDGKVYHIDRQKKVTVYFEPKEKYIWSLAVLADGSLAVGTGENGRIYRVTAPGTGTIFFDSSDTHITALTADKGGNLYAGTDSKGIVLRFDPNGKPFALLDSPLREIHEIALAPDGSVYVLAMGDSASASAGAPDAKPAASPEEKPLTVERTTSGNPEPSPKSRYDLSSARSAVYRILPDGNTDVIWASSSVSGFAIAADRSEGVLLGTSDKGRVYRVANDGTETLLLQSDAGQISAIRPSGNGYFAASSNLGKLFKWSDASDGEGIYESAVLDARSTATWGRIWWRAAGDIRIETRSGNTEKADETWSGWSAVSGDRTGVSASPRARYFQWRAFLKGNATLNEVNLAFLSRNIAPEVLSVTILPVNVGLAANPPVQVDPNIVLSGLDPSFFGIPLTAPPPRRIYQRGARSFQWSAEDRDGDRLLYDIYYKDVREREMKLLRSDLDANFITVDGLSLPDGRYVIKVVAKDILGNAKAETLAGERTSEPFDIDNTQPTVTLFGTPVVSSGGAKMVFDAADAAGYLVRAEYSVNGGEWTPVNSEDGISDSPKERYVVNAVLPVPGEYTITIRVFDSSGNAGNGRAVVTR